MKKKYNLLLLVIIATLFSCQHKGKSKIEKFEPTVESLQQYETPAWFNDAKFGIWVCWNAYTVPAVGDWYARRMYEEGHPHYNYHVKTYGHPSKFGYKDIVDLWKGEKFNADELVDLFVDTGAKYIVTMANHHDNFDLWNSKNHEWNSVNYGPKRDIVGEMHKAVKKYEDQGIRWGVTSHLERTWSWFQTNKGSDKYGKYAGVPYDGNDPKYQGIYLPPDANGDISPTQPINAPLEWRKEWLSRCMDLIDNYDPDLFYVDGGVPFYGDDEGKTGMTMISNLYNQSIERNNGTNEAVMCIKDLTKKMPNGEGGYYWDGVATLDLERTRLPKIRKSPWQTDTSIGAWTYVRDGWYRSGTTLIHELIDVVSKNGNILLNVSPMSNGSLDEKAYQLLKEIGAWMKINGGSIYGTRPWEINGNEDQRIVRKGENTIYVSLLKKPKGRLVQIPYLAPAKGASLGITDVKILGYKKEELEWKVSPNGIVIQLPENITFKHALVIRINGTNLNDYEKSLLEDKNNHGEELKIWWETQRVSRVNSSYKRIACDGQNRIWAINSENDIVQVIDGKELPFGDFKAKDIGASSYGIIVTDLEGRVFAHKFTNTEWRPIVPIMEQETKPNADGSNWIEISGVKAKRCDILTNGVMWVIDESDEVVYYATNQWKKLNKQAEDIGCGKTGNVAIIANGQLESFEGAKWKNLGGENLKSVDISTRDNVIVTLDKEGDISVRDVFGWRKIKPIEGIKDISCGQKNDDESIAIIK
jgi:alpha-L-fucosidase